MRMMLALVVAGGLAGACSVAPPVPSETTPSEAGALSTPAATRPETPAATPVRSPSPTQSATPVSSPSSTPTATAPPDVVVELADALLTERVNATLTGRPLMETPFGMATVSYVTVHVAESGIVLTGEAQAGFIRLPIGTSGTVSVVDGRPIVGLGDVTVGSVVAPEPVRLGMQAALQQEVDRAIVQDDARVKAVELEDGKLTVRGAGRGP